MPGPARRRPQPRAGRVLRLSHPERFGTLHILVNNAGTGQFAPFAFMENEEYDRVRDINVRGMFHFCRAVLPTMMDNDYGKIVNITSIMSVMAGQGQSIYNAARARPRC